MSAVPLTLLALASFASLAPPPATAQEPDSAAALLKVSVTVRDALSNEAVAGAVVELSGLPGRHVTDDDGTATFEVPAGWYRLAVRKSGYAPIDGDFPVSRATETTLTMRRQVADALIAPGALLVKVTEAGSGSPLESAEVSLVGGSERRLTNRRGMATFGDLRSSWVEVAVRRIGYAPRTEPVLLEAERTTLMTIPMTVEAVYLAPLEVEVRSQFLEAQGVYWRIDHDRTMHVFDADSLIARMKGSPLLGHAFTRLPGLFVWYTGGAPSFLGSRKCEIGVFWDGMPYWTNPYGHFDDIPPEAVELVEVYTGVRTPTRFQRWPGDLNNCGAIVFWSTKRADWTRKGGEG